MDATKDQLEEIFNAKTPLLISALEAWFEEETASIDGTVPAGAPSGSGGSIIAMRPAIDSKRVIDATSVTKEVLGIELPPEIIKAGGYASCDEMIADIVPKLQKVFAGEIKVKKRKTIREPEKV
ncbi:hypothetical protein [Limobrevibacterium gyesilva]|uniref:Uncharacterized protein n=1 Tax=Limobrevibacterium gyesilva TaxID=2991712 RepID=A0AA41YMG1_9PROT|nr:hypothetical protein [Limobrevibacterium gyesilva]MCW3474688.1 hypothetical protein [Limobrevibacterium gyesilva]